MAVDAATKFWSRCVEVDGCLVWTGARNRDGYGNLYWDGRTQSAHRVGFYLTHGRWPEPVARHTCRRRNCVRHVIEGSQSENVHDSVADGTHPQARNTACPQGHPYTPETTGRYGGGRYCRTCKTIRSREWRLRRRQGDPS